MKTRSNLFIAALATMLVCLYACQPKEKEVEEIVEVPKVDLINDEFPEAQKEIQETIAAIGQSINDKDIEKLLSFHAYGPKFTEFAEGKPRHGSEGNKAIETNVFGSVTEIVKMDMNDMKIAVYGDVANVTFHSDFQLKFGDDLAVVENQISLLFVKTDAGWKIVHEHHSPLVKEDA